MARFKDRLASFGKDLKGIASSAKDKTLDTINSVDVHSSMQRVKDATATAAISSIDYGKEKTQGIKTNILSATENFDFDQLTKKEFYSDKIKEYSLYGAEKVTQGFKSTFEIDRDTNEIINDLRKRLPVPPSDISDIFEQCKQEAFSRAVSAFLLAPLLSGLDQNSADKYANLSQKYKDFANENILTDNPNFAKLKNERNDAKKQYKPLEDGYNSQNRLDPYSADIEHIVPKKEIYDNFILRIATTDDQIIESMNFEDNLIFADGSLNSSMQHVDILKYIEARGVPDDIDNDIIHIDIKGKDVTVKKSEVGEKYKKAQEKVNKMKIDALKEIGITVASSATKVAIQQVVGLIIVETIDIFVDEIKDMTVEGNFFTADTFTQSILDRKDKINVKLSERFEERQILSRAKALGIESGIAGALSVIPQVLISLLVKMPAFVLAIIRECTLSAVRCVRVLFDPSIDKYAAIKVIMAGTVTAVLGVYVARVISNAIIPVPILNLCNKQVTEVLSGVFVAALSLSAIYCVEKNKSKLLFTIGK